MGQHAARCGICYGDCTGQLSPGSWFMGCNMRLVLSRKALPAACCSTPVQDDVKSISRMCCLCGKMLFPLLSGGSEQTPRSAGGAVGWNLLPHGLEGDGNRARRRAASRPFPERKRRAVVVLVYEFPLQEQGTLVGPLARPANSAGPSED